jgi:DNA polymerase-3 subunit epsilon
MDKTMSDYKFTTLVFDTETTGLVDFKNPDDVDKQPHLVQLAAQLVDPETVWSKVELIVRPPVKIPKAASDVHGIDERVATKYGVPTRVAVAMFNNLLRVADRIAGHNIDFDLAVMFAEYKRNNAPLDLFTTDNKSPDYRPRICTMRTAEGVLKLPGKFPDSYKWPTLSEAFAYFTGETFDAHDAGEDVDATITVLENLEQLSDVKLVGGKL